MDEQPKFNQAILDFHLKIMDQYDSEILGSLQDAVIFGNGCIHVYPDETGKIVVKRVPFKFKTKRWWQFWKSDGR